MISLGTRAGLAWLCLAAQSAVGLGVAPGMVLCIASDHVMVEPAHESGCAPRPAGGRIADRAPVGDGCTDVALFTASRDRPDAPERDGSLRVSPLFRAASGRAPATGGQASSLARPPEHTPSVPRLLRTIVLLV